MIIYPAIDIKNGKCVRLLQGDASKVTVYDQDPAAVAKRWQEQGAEIIHIVDLDGAFEGTPKNLEAVKRITQAVDIPVQFGGGVRTIDTMQRVFEAEVALVVLGTAVVLDKRLMKSALANFGERIVAGIDAKDGMVAIKGWTETTGEDVIELAEEMEDMGVSRIIYTDISKDGMMVGPNVNAVQALAESVDVPVIASGGVSSLDDIRALKDIEVFGVEGVIVGKALYEKSFTLEEAMEAAGIAG